MAFFLKTTKRSEKNNLNTETKV